MEYIQGIVDKNPEKRFFLSGSTNFELMKGLVESLPGREGGVFFYRDSNQNEVDIILKQEGKITAMEVKSSMTYNPSFESSLKSLPSWVSTPINERAVIYNGDFQNELGVVKIVNFMNMNQLLPIIENE